MRRCCSTGRACRLSSQIPEYYTIPEETGVNNEGNLTIRISRVSFDEFGKGGEPRRNQFTIDGMKYRVVNVKSLPENPILEFEVKQDS